MSLVLDLSSELEAELAAQDVVAQQAGVPIRQPNATVRFGFADPGRVGGAVDAISFG